MPFMFSFVPGESTSMVFSPFGICICPRSFCELKGSLCSTIIDSSLESSVRGVTNTAFQQISQLHCNYWISIVQSSKMYRLILTKRLNIYTLIFKIGFNQKIYAINKHNYYLCIILWLTCAQTILVCSLTNSILFSFTKATATWLIHIFFELHLYSKMSHPAITINNYYTHTFDLSDKMFLTSCFFKVWSCIDKVLMIVVHSDYSACKT